MFKNKFSKLLLPLVALTLSGCSLNFNTGTGSNSTSSASDGGVFRSLDKGNSWEQKVLISDVSRARSFSGVDIISLSLDPGDNKAIYAGSSGNGLFYSYDGAESWQVAFSLGKVNINSVAVDPANKCVIYAAVANKVFKSEDCSRAWAQIYFDNDVKAMVSSLVIDHASSNNIFIGTSRGDIIKSSNKGLSWRVLDRFDSQVDKIVISPVNSKVMLAGTTDKSVFRSIDGGNKWESLAPKLKAFEGSNRFRDLVMVKSEKAIIFLVANYGLLRSADDGASWSKIELLTAEEEAEIHAIAVNPDDAEEIYYTTGTTFYHSLDGGKNWISRKLPTGRAGARLLLDPRNPAIVYLAARDFKR